MRLTDRQVINLKPKEERYEVWEGNGFGIRVFPTGRKSWVMMYRFQGRLRRLTLGMYPKMTVAQAHAASGKALADIEQNLDPAETVVNEREEARKAPTVEFLAQEYIEKWAKSRKRSWKEDQRILNKDVLPLWGKKKAKDISRKNVIRLLDNIVERGSPISANRTLEIIRKMFNFGIERDLVVANPCVMVRAPSSENRRDRILTEEEVQIFWSKLDQARMSKAVQLALKLQLTTAQRRGEIVTAEWSEIDFNNRWWTIPSEKSKNNLAHRVPLSTLAISLLEEALAISSGSDFIFPNPTMTGHINPGAVTRALGKNRIYIGIENFTPHDLRRTAASYMTSIGISRLVVSKILNHAETGVTAVYDRHSYDTEKEHALNQWAQVLTSIVSD